VDRYRARNNGEWGRLFQKVGAANLNELIVERFIELVGEAALRSAV